MVGMSLMTLSILNDARTLANAWTIKSRLGAKLWQDAWTVAMPRTRRARPDTCSDLGARTFLFAWPQVARVGSFSPGQSKIPGRLRTLAQLVARGRNMREPGRPDIRHFLDARAVRQNFGKPIRASVAARTEVIARTPGHLGKPARPPCWTLDNAASLDAYAPGR